jgi:hypothetical protein
MAYCGPKGIPLSQFLAWDKTDQDAALAWQQHENRRCSGCGTHPDDWNEKAGGDRHAWHAEHAACPGCAALEHHRELPEMQDNRIKGLQLRLAPGPNGTCPRCRPLPK